MRIYTKAGDLVFTKFTFPDGQPHVRLEYHELEFKQVTIEAAIRNPEELFQVQLVTDVLRSSGYSEINLDIRYLMGARMDRAIDTKQPYTLGVVARIINGLGFTQVRVLDVHSHVAGYLIRNTKNLLPKAILTGVKATLGHVQIVAPDKGAVDRARELFPEDYVVRCEKVRDSQSGRLSGFKVLDPSVILDQDCLVIDDICDGGGTFTGISQELKKAGAKRVYLFVTHGIFSKTLPLELVDRIFTTDSYFGEAELARYYGNIQNGDLVVIPIHMKDLE